MVGQNIGKYRVADRVGRGGMGTVYRAVDETLHREVAIKVLNAELNDPEVAKRFRAEAITVARLSHPGIATIYELFQHEGQWLMVMEFVRGETLEHMVERMGPISPQRAAELSMQALGALAHAHSMGVVHRDLKPANLMITETGAIKIMDFGIARVAGTEHLTSAGFMMGTPAYMAPEQVMGNEIDARADLYALGVVFYRLTTAKLPFRGETPFAMAQSQVNDPPTPMGMFRTDLPTWVEQVVVRALAKSPEERFQSAIEFHEAFARCLAGLPMTSLYSSSAPTELMMTPPRAMPTGSILRPPTSGLPSYPGAVSAQIPVSPPTAGTPADLETRFSDRTPYPSGSIGPLTPSAQAGAPLSGSVPLPTTGAGTGPVQAAPGPVAPPKSRTGLAAAAAVVVVLAGAAAFFVLRPGGGPPATETTAVEPTAPAPDAPVLPSSPVDPGSPNPAGSPAKGTTPAAASPGVPSATSVAAPSVGSSLPTTTRGRASAETAGAQPPATSPSAAPPAVTTAAGARRGNGPVDDTQQAFTDTKVLTVDGRRARDEDALVSFAAGQITVLGRKAGNAIAAMPYKSVARATYVRGREPKWNTSLPSPPENLDVPGGFLRTAKHWLTLQTKDAFLILQLDGSNWTRVLQTVEARTGLTIDRPQQTGK